MTVSFGAAGAGTNAAGSSINLAHPTGISAGHYLTAVIFSGDPTSSIPATPSGWTLLGTDANTDGTFATADAGPRRCTIFGKEATGSESGTVTISFTGGTGAVLVGIMYRWTKTLTFWDVVGLSGHYELANGTFTSVAMASVPLDVGDVVFTATASPDDTQAISGQAIAATGITFGALTEMLDSGATAGNDLRNVACRWGAITAGSGTLTLTYTTTQDESVGLAGVRFRDTNTSGDALDEDLGPDGGTATDSAVPALTRAREFTDGGTATDTVTAAVGRSRPLTDGGDATDTMSRALARARQVLDGGTAVDTLGRVVARARALTDGGTASDVFGAAVARARSLLDAGTVADVLSWLIGLERPFLDTGAAGDAVAAVMARARSFLDAGEATDSISYVLDNGIYAPTGPGFDAVTLAHVVESVELAHSIESVGPAHEIVAVVSLGGAMDIRTEGIESLSAEEVFARLRSRQDPTGTLPEFAVTTLGRGEVDAIDLDWVAGAWVGAWDAATGRVDACTPTIGEAGALVVEAGTIVDLYARWSTATADPVKVYQGIPIR